MNYRIIQGDCIEGMRTLADESVHCVVTSPPYYGLRDYGTASWKGGDAACDHVEIRNTSTSSTLDSSVNGIASAQTLIKDNRQFKDICGKCGARRIDQQIGLEESPDAYVAKMVDVFREVHRILRNDGTLWLNLGDSYAGGGTIGRNDTDPESLARRAEKYGTGQKEGSMVGAKGTRKPVATLKAKDLIGIPWRVAFALQADGWYLRQDIIWHKPNPMPESVTDRCTKAHEYIFLLSKSERYYYDNEAIKLPTLQDWGTRDRSKYKYATDGTGIGGHSGMDKNYTTANRRSVWTVATKPYAEAHFAVYPPKLIEPCILAGCPVDGTVFDPFNGSGTTGYVALCNNRHYIGTELNPEYVALTDKRLSAIQPKMNLV